LLYCRIRFPYFLKSQGQTQNSVEIEASIDAATFDPRFLNMDVAKSGKVAQKIVRVKAVEAHADDAYMV
jgi:hypothetical protein